MFTYAKCRGSPWLLHIPAGDDKGKGKLRWVTYWPSLFWPERWSALLCICWQVTCSVTAALHILNRPWSAHGADNNACKRICRHRKERGFASFASLLRLKAVPRQRKVKLSFRLFLVAAHKNLIVTQFVQLQGRESKVWVQIASDVLLFWRATYSMRAGL